jgi:hypothetical protein
MLGFISVNSIVLQGLRNAVDKHLLAAREPRFKHLIQTILMPLVNTRAIASPKGFQLFERRQ